VTLRCLGCWHEHAEALAPRGVGEARVEGHEGNPAGKDSAASIAAPQLQRVRSTDVVDTEEPSGRSAHRCDGIDLDPRFRQGTEELAPNWPGKGTGTMARHGEVAEWLKAAPC
jgi:hypothetical protein